METPGPSGFVPALGGGQAGGSAPRPAAGNTAFDQLMGQLKRLMQSQAIVLQRLEAIESRQVSLAEAFETRMSDVEDTLERLSEALDQRDGSEPDGFESQLDELQSDVSAMRSSLSDLESTISTIEATVENIESAVDGIQSSVDNL